MFDFKDILINIFFIFSPLVFYPYLLKIRKKLLLKSILLCILCSVALISTMYFPIKINDLIFDFRAIPLTIGSLYGGVYISLLLYIVLIIYRDILGNANQLEYIISILPTFVIVLFFIKRYHSFRLFQKIVVAIITYFFIRNFTLVTYLFLTQNIKSLFNNNFLLTLIIIIFQCLLAGIYVYFLEILHKSFQQQEEIIKSDKIRIVSDIAASVAHEIRNPLTSVRGFIQLLGNEELNKEKRNFYKQLSLEELDRTQQIISDYLSLAKPEPVNIEIIDIRNEIVYVSNILLSYSNYENIKINNILLENNFLIIGDKHKFRQALINIGKNAIEAMQGEGILGFEAIKTENVGMLFITDTGIGMTKEQINRLGTPYYSTREKGTGLGTMVSFGIIKKMHGNINITSEIGKGTTIMIRFPLSRL